MQIKSACRKNNPETFKSLVVIIPTIDTTKIKDRSIIIIIIMMIPLCIIIYFSPHLI